MSVSIIRNKCLCLATNYPNGVASILPRYLNDNTKKHFSSKTTSRHSKLTLLEKHTQNRIANLRNFANHVVESPFGGSPELSHQSLVHFTYRNFEEWGDEPAVTCAVSGRSYTFTMLRLLVNRCAQALLGHCGLKPGDVVGLILPNIPEFFIVAHGASEAGLIVTTVNPLYTPDEIKKQFQNAGVKSIITIQLFMEIALKMATELKDYKTTICVGGEDDLERNVHGLQSLLMAGHSSDLPELNPEALCFLPFSSGTTGLPKGVMLSHNNLIVNMMQWSHPLIKEQIARDGKRHRVFTILPFFHIFGFTSSTLTIGDGGQLITIPRFTPEDYLKTLIEQRPTYLCLVPPILSFLASHPDVTPDHLASVESILSGAVTLNQATVKQFRDRFKRDDILIRQGYGMTETSPVTLSVPLNPPSSKQVSAGLLLPGTEAKIIDLATGEPLGPNQTGELVVRGKQIMMGYLNNEQATKETVDQDGWLHTGDVAYYDEDGYFFIVDRCKELIKVKGNQVSPSELENHLIKIEGIADAAVVGIPDEKAGEVPKAFIVKSNGSKITEEEIQNIMNSKVSKDKKLVGGVQFVDAIPRSLAGKIMRNELKAMQ